MPKSRKKYNSNKGTRKIVKIPKSNGENSFKQPKKKSLISLAIYLK